MMNVKLLLSIVLIIPSIVFANDFVIKNVKNEAFKESDFPFFSSEKYPQSAIKINQVIQFEFFDKVYKESDFSDPKLSPFRGGFGDRSAYVYGFDVSESENYIKLSIIAEGCGAYCEGFTSSYIFDVYTGKVISLIDLLSSVGIKHLEQKIREINKSRLKPYIKKPDTSGTRNDEFGMMEEEQFSMYLYCYKALFIDNPSSYNKITASTSFTLENNKISISHGRCSNHASRALDEIGRFVNKFTFNELDNYLTQDAKIYLSDKPHKLSVIKTPNQVYHGKIANKYPITVIKKKYSGWAYWYDKYNKKIDLNSVETGDDNTYVLQEGHHNGINKWIYTSEFRMTKSNGVFKGMFVNLESGKEMPVDFK